MRMVSIASGSSGNCSGGRNYAVAESAESEDDIPADKKGG